MTSKDIKNALFAYFRPPEWAGFDELRDGTGMACLRSFDFWAINCYPSTGHRTVGIEIKISRSDFLRELNKPAKRESIEAYAMETYFACPLGILKPDELPEKWGLITVSEKGARIAKRAVQRDNITFDLNFLASVCRRSAEIVASKEGLERRQAELKADIAESEKYLRDKWDEYLKDHEELLIHTAKAKAVEELIGDGIDELRRLMDKELGWANGNRDIAQRLVAFYRHVKAGKHVENQLKNVKNTLERTLNELNKLEVSA